jgi:hypothetical protein
MASTTISTINIADLSRTPEFISFQKSLVWESVYHNPIFDLQPRLNPNEIPSMFSLTRTDLFNCQHQLLFNINVIVAHIQAGMAVMTALTTNPKSTDAYEGMQILPSGWA